MLDNERNQLKNAGEIIADYFNDNGFEKQDVRNLLLVSSDRMDVEDAYNKYQHEYIDQATMYRGEQIDIISELTYELCDQDVVQKVYNTHTLAQVQLYALFNEYPEELRAEIVKYFDLNY
jgi:DNA helicase IV